MDRRVLESLDQIACEHPDGTVLGQINPYQDAPTGYDSAGPFIVDAHGDVYTGIWRVKNEVMKLDPVFFSSRGFTVENSIRARLRFGRVGEHFGVWCSR